MSLRSCDTLVGQPFLLVVLALVVLLVVAVRSGGGGDRFSRVTGDSSSSSSPSSCFYPFSSSYPSSISPSNQVTLRGRRHRRGTVPLASVPFTARSLRVTQLRGTFAGIARRYRISSSSSTISTDAAASVAVGAVAIAVALLPARGVTPTLRGLRNTIVASRGRRWHVNTRRQHVPRGITVTHSGYTSNPVSLCRGRKTSGHTREQWRSGRLHRPLNGVAAIVPPSIVTAASIVVTTGACAGVTDDTIRARRYREVTLRKEAMHRARLSND